MTGRSKRDDILQAAGELIDVHGYDALSTTDIARRAGVSTATLYRYFPDKAQVIKGLVIQQHQERGERVMAFLARLETEPDWRAVVRELLQNMHDMRLSVPGGRSARRALFASPELQAWGLQQSQHIADALSAALCRRKPELPPERAQRMAIVVVSATVPLLDLASSDPKQAPIILRDTADMFIAYLSAWFE